MSALPVRTFLSGSTDVGTACTHIPVRKYWCRHCLYAHSCQEVAQTIIMIDRNFALHERNPGAVAADYAILACGSVTVPPSHDRKSWPLEADIAITDHSSPT
jgi:hypothetical protein